MDNLLNSYETFKLKEKEEKELEVKLKWKDNFLFSDKNLKSFGIPVEETTIDLIQSKNSNRTRIFLEGENKGSVITVFKNSVVYWDWKEWSARVAFSTEAKIKPITSFDLIRFKKTKHYLIERSGMKVSLDVSDVIETTMNGKIENDSFKQFSGFKPEGKSTREVEIEVIKTSSNWKLSFKSTMIKIMEEILKSPHKITYQERNNILQTLNYILFGKSEGFVKFKPNQPLPLSFKDVQNGVLKNPYAVTLKYDGVRKLLFGTQVDNYIYFGYMVPSLEVISRVSINDYPNLNPFIVDGELVEYNNMNIYCIFDLILWGSSMIHLPLYHSANDCRLYQLSQLLDYFSQFGKNLKPKTIYDLPGLKLVLLKKQYNIAVPYNMENLTKAIKKALSDTVLLPGISKPIKFEDDGLIFTPITENYENSVYKWKPIEKLTIDFYVMNNGILGVQKGNSIIPFIGSKKYPIEQQKVEEETNKIGEFLWNGKNFVLLRWREEKTAPNYITTAETNWDLVQDPLTMDIIMGKSTKGVDIYHDSVKKQILSYLKAKGIKTIVDLKSKSHDQELWKDYNFNVISVSKLGTKNKRICYDSISDIKSTVKACVCFNMEELNIFDVDKLEKIYNPNQTCYFTGITLDRKNILKKVQNGPFIIEQEGKTIFKVEVKDDVAIVEIKGKTEKLKMFSTDEFILRMNERLLFNLVPEVDEYLNANKKNYFSISNLNESEKSISEIFRVIVLKRNIIPYVNDLKIRNLFPLDIGTYIPYDHICDVDMFRIGTPSDPSSFFYCICQIFNKDFRSLDLSKKIDYIHILRQNLSEKSKKENLGFYYVYPSGSDIEFTSQTLKINIVLIDGYSKTIEKYSQDNKNPTCFVIKIDQHYEILGIPVNENQFKVIINPKDDDQEILQCK